jgi:Predicted nucleotide-binding protein containing TIR-like domain
MANALPSLFIASSVEGMPIAEAVQKGLNYAANAEIWNQATFDLSSVTIDALLKKCGAMDFAVFVLTPDDVKLKREKKTAAARDNVIFELGLFSGTLGRERCFLVHERNKETKPIELPSDLAGITPATFRRHDSGNLDASLGPVCSEIKNSIARQKQRHKLSESELASAQEISAFCDRIVGHWWQRVLPDDASALSFVLVEPDPVTGTVKMGGVAYHTDGTEIADWSSMGISIDKDNRKLSYIWEGTHPKQPDPYQGFGMVAFDNATEAFTSGRGHFFNANLADLKTARRKSLAFRRCTNQKELTIMQGGEAGKIAALVKNKLKIMKADEAGKIAAQVKKKLGRRELGARSRAR